MKNSYVLISKPNEKLLFDDIFRDSQNGGKYSKTIVDKMEELSHTGKTQFWSGSENQFLYMALGYIGVHIVCNGKCHSYNKFTKTWNIEEQTKPVKYMSLKNFSKLNIYNNKYMFEKVSSTFLGDRYEVTHVTKDTCPVVDYIKNRDNQRQRKQKVSKDLFNDYIKKHNAKQKTENDVVR